MKRPIFVIVGVVIVFILLLVWLYMLFINNPQSNTDNYADLNLTDTTDNSVITPIEESSLVDIFSPEPLRQLTTKTVAGYQEVLKDASSTPEVFYAESGTGNIFSINLATGEEVKISKTTVPNSRKAAITPKGSYVLFQSNLGTGSTFFLGEFSSTSDEVFLTDFEANLISFKASAENTFLYAIETNDSVIAKEYFPTTGKDLVLFTIPFREAVVSWGETATASHYVYPKASSKLEGYLYEVKVGQLKRLPIEGYGLSAAGNGYSVIYGEQNSSLDFESYSFAGGLNLLLPFDLLPEKCVFSNLSSSTVICGVGIYDNNNLPDTWYQGLSSSVDSLWSVDLTTNSATLLINTFFETNRELDMINLTISDNTNVVYFINKNDQTLWLYDLNLFQSSLELE
jgi:hypothetical protein